MLEHKVHLSQSQELINRISSELLSLNLLYEHHSQEPRAQIPHANSSCLSLPYNHSAAIILLLSSAITQKNEGFLTLGVVKLLYNFNTNYISGVNANMSCTLAIIALLSLKPFTST